MQNGCQHFPHLKMPSFQRFVDCKATNVVAKWARDTRLEAARSMLTASHTLGYRYEYNFKCPAIPDRR